MGPPVVRAAVGANDILLVYRPKLLRRLFTLQKRLEHFGVSDINFVQMDNLAQRKPAEVRIEGERIHAAVDVAWNVVKSGKATRGGGAGGSKRRKVEKDDGKQTKLPFIFAAAVPDKGPEISDMKVCLIHVFPTSRSHDFLYVAQEPDRKVRLARPRRRRSQRRDVRASAL